jgi:hypothetical protein
LKVATYFSRQESGRNGASGIDGVELIGRSYSALSPSHRRVADFILSSPHQAALMTLDDMSRATAFPKRLQTASPSGSASRLA